MSVEVVHWNPRRAVAARFGKLVPVRRPVNNFGDMLGPLIVDKLVERLGLRPALGAHRLVAVGSILRLAREGDIVWGAGANGKSVDKPLDVTSLDVRAVRGPLTRDYLQEQGIPCPDIYGDPGLLVGHLWTREELQGTRPARAVTIVPNLHDFPRYRRDPRAVNPRSPVWDVVGQIASSDMVVGSSLHGVVIAESLGIPACLVASETEPRFKYDDYYLGTNRDIPRVAPDVDSAIESGGAPSLEWSPRNLIESFPRDLWT
ncbi:polysaccharide pyruvyl transferase family protein [Microbacterium sp. E-13]|uniref:polysaccharide pyruvyl transferase family protein n=1 Tax=Microbacterium sp. E-13 TaxID=3404048 RepID=UPI003CE69892